MTAGKTELVDKVHAALSAVCCTNPHSAKCATSATSVSVKRPRPRSASMAAIRCRNVSRFSTGIERAARMTT